MLAVNGVGLGDAQPLQRLVLDEAIGAQEKARASMMSHVTKAGALLADHLEAQGIWNPK